MNLYFTSKIRDCLDLSTGYANGLTNAFMLNICNDCVQFQMEIRKFSHRRPLSVDEAEFGHLTLLFCSDGKEMYKDLERTCTAMALLVKPFVW